jgi:hypothetical protein
MKRYRVGRYVTRYDPPLRPVLIVERDNGQYERNVYGERCDGEALLTRMKKDGLGRAEPVPALLRRQTQDGKRFYWVRVWAVPAGGEAFRIYERRAGRIFSPDEYVADGIWLRE